MEHLKVVWLIQPGMQERLRRLYQEAQGSRRFQYEMSRRQAEIEQEHAWVIQVHCGELVFTILDTQKPFLTLLHLVTSELPFDHWFQEKMQNLIGWSLQDTQLDPRSDLIFVWPDAQEEPGSSQWYDVKNSCM